MLELADTGASKPVYESQPGALTFNSIMSEVATSMNEHRAATMMTGIALGLGAVSVLRFKHDIRVFPVINCQTTLSHLTSAEAAADIKKIGKIGGQWGVFAIQDNMIPDSQWQRSASTWILRSLRHEIGIPHEVSDVFEKPFPVGPISLFRNAIGLHSAPLGSIDLKNLTFVKDEIFKAFQHIGILSLEFHVDKLSRPLL